MKALVYKPTQTLEVKKRVTPQIPQGTTFKTIKLTFNLVWIQKLKYLNKDKTLTENFYQRCTSKFDIWLHRFCMLDACIWGKKTKQTNNVLSVSV